MEPAEPSKSSPKVVEMGPATRPPQAHLSEHLANERTYLAYLRTAISLISFGITINRFSIYLVQSKLPPRTSLANVGLNWSQSDWLRHGDLWPGFAGLGGAPLQPRN